MTADSQTSGATLAGVAVATIEHPDDLVPLHHQLLTDATNHGGHTSTAQSLVRVAAVVDNLASAWRLRLHQPDASKIARTCLTTLAAADPARMTSVRIALPHSWIDHLRMLPITEPAAQRVTTRSAP